jgi:hypothetical protein
MPYQSRNPIYASFTVDPLLPVELEIYIEKATTLDSFDSLGVYAFTSNADGEISENIQGVLHAALMDRLDLSLPDQGTDPVLVDGLSRKFKYRYRSFDVGTWSSWTDSSVDFVVLGGVAHEVFSNSFNTTAAAAPTILLPEPNGIALSIAQGWVYVLCHTSGTLTCTHRYFLADGTDETSSDTISVDRAYRVVRVPVFPPAAPRIAQFNLELTIGSVTRTVSLVVDRQYRHKRYNFAWVSAGGGWAFIETLVSQSALIEVSQSIAEIDIPESYFDGEIHSLKVWKSTGQKKIRTATGFWPQEYLDTTIQDFLLSPKRMYWSADLQRWIPLLVNTRSGTYRSELQGNLRSFVFEFSPAFQNNLPSPL